VSSGVATALLLAWIKACALTYGVDPEFAAAVAIVESRPTGGGMEMRCGPLGRSGKYVGPMGLNRCFAGKYDIYSPWENIRVGVKALRGNQMSALKRYNASCTPAYIREVFKIKRQLKREGKSDG
jgi:hypothetical protein